MFCKSYVDGYIVICKNVRKSELAMSFAMISKMEYAESVGEKCRIY